MAMALIVWPLLAGKVIDGHFNGRVVQYAHADRDMAYIGKFCFQCVGECGRKHGNKQAVDDLTHTLAYEAGVVRVTAHGGNEPGQKLAVFLSENYYDPTRSWRHVFRNPRLSCNEKLAKAVDVIDLSPPPPPNASATYNDDVYGDQAVQRTEYIELSTRPQFFHFAAMNCERGTLFSYFVLKLFNPGGFTTRHFSYEDQGLLTLEGFMLALSLVMALISLEGVFSLSHSRLHHPPLFILNNALWLLVVSHALSVYFYNSYATFGRAPEGALMWAELCFLAMDLIVMLLCLLIARGWRVTVETFERREAIVVIASASGYVCVYALVYCVDMVTREPAEDVYPLMSGGALWLVLFRLGMGGLCALFVQRTYRSEMSPAKRLFYRRFVTIALLWFLAQPVAIVLALSMDELVRHKNATAVLYTVTHALLALILFTLRPMRAAPYFTMSAYEDELEDLVQASRPQPHAHREAGGHASRDEPPRTRYRDADVGDADRAREAGWPQPATYGEAQQRYADEPGTPEPRVLHAPDPPVVELISGLPAPSTGDAAAAAAAAAHEPATRTAPKPKAELEQDGML